MPRCPDPTCREGLLGILVDVGTPIHCTTCLSSIGILCTSNASDAFDEFDEFISTHQLPYFVNQMANA